MARDAVIHLTLDEITIPDGRRPVRPEAVKALVQSIEKIGLQTPITCRKAKGDGFDLIAGRHRLEAFRSLKREAIPAVIVKMGDRDARKWEIAENLHRADLTELERKLEIAEWIRLTEEELLEGVSSQVATKPQGGRPQGGIRAAARELGVDKDEAHRAVKVGSISERARKAVVEAKLDNNQSALLKIASVTPDKQVERVRELVAARDARRKPEPPSDAPRNDYELINKQHRALVRAWEAARPEARDQFLADIGASLDGAPVMDRGAA